MPPYFRVFKTFESKIIQMSVSLSCSGKSIVMQVQSEPELLNQ